MFRLALGFIDATIMLVLTGFIFGEGYQLIHLRLSLCGGGQHNLRVSDLDSESVRVQLIFGVWSTGHEVKFSKKEIETT